MKVRLNEKLDKAGLGFTDQINHQEIRAKKPGKREIIEVKDSHFVQDKIRSGELELVEPEEGSAGLSGGSDAPTDAELNATREAMIAAEAALEKAKADIKNAEDATQKALCKDAINKAVSDLRDAKDDLKRLEKLAK
jgi:hypothetical protein